MAAMPPVEPAPAASQTMLARHAGHMAPLPPWPGMRRRGFVGGFGLYSHDVPAEGISTSRTAARGQGLDHDRGDGEPGQALGPVAAGEQESPDGVVFGQTDGPAEGLGRGDPPAQTLEKMRA